MATVVAVRRPHRRGGQLGAYWLFHFRQPRPARAEGRSRPAWACVEAGERLIDHLACEASLQRDGHLVCEHPLAAHPWRLDLRCRSPRIWKKWRAFPTLFVLWRVWCCV